MYRVLKDYISSNPANSLKAFKVLTSNLHYNSELGHRLMYSFAVFSTWRHFSVGDLEENLSSATALTPSLQQLLDYSEVWLALIDWCSQGHESDRVSSEESRLVHMLHRVQDLISSVTIELVQGEIDLQKLHIVLRKNRTFLELVGGIRTIAKPESLSCDIDSLDRELKNFDRTFEHLQTFASFFCSW